MITMLPVTICFTVFRSLGLPNLLAALWSVRQQTFDKVEAMVVIDNNSEISGHDIQAAVDELEFPIPVSVFSFKHNDESKTHAWSSNIAVRAAFTQWVLFTRADYVLDFNIVMKMLSVVESKPDDWDGFVTGNVYHLGVNVDECCNSTEWKKQGAHVLRGLPGIENIYTCIDAGVWMARRSAFCDVGGIEEQLTAWGHAQTHFQHKLYEHGTEFVRIPEVLFYHPNHAAPRDLGLAHEQLQSLGIDIRTLWARYEGMQPYGRAS